MFKLLDGFKFFLNPAWVANMFFTLWGKGGGGGGPTTSTSYSTNLPEYAQPFYEELLKQAGKQSFTTDESGNVTGIKPMPVYTGERVAGFNPEQTAIQQQVAGLQTPGQFGQATAGLSAGQNLGYGASVAGLNQALGYAPSNISAQNVSAQNVSVPRLQNFGMNAAQLAYNPNLLNYQMGPAQNVAASGIGTQNFSQGAANYYMSPYAQAAINPALREARLQGDLQKQAGMTGAMGRGTFGGARQALLQAEQERGTQRNIADIQATGMEKAYQNAQAQFQADQARQLQAQQANQQYGLQAQLANQQAGLTTGQQNLAALLGVQQLGTQSGLQAQLANLSNAQQANVQNLAAQLQTQGLSADQAIRAALANQQSSLTAQQLNQQANLQAQQLSQQGKQFAAGLGKDVGLAGLQAGLEGSKALGALGAAEQQTNLERLKAQTATAEEKQALQQQINDLEYQKFQEKENYQRSLLEYYSNILRGNAGALGSSQVAYTPAPSMASQIGGLGLAGLGLANVLGRG
jgi:hypothetical protein